MIRTFKEHLDSLDDIKRNKAIKIFENSVSRNTKDFIILGVRYRVPDPVEVGRLIDVSSILSDDENYDLIESDESLYNFSVGSPDLTPRLFNSSHSDESLFNFSVGSPDLTPSLSLH